LTTTFAVSAPALWYLSRGSGAVSLILLSVAVALGVVDQRRWYAPRWPRFAVHSLHRWVSLFALCFLLVHILSAVVDSFAPIGLLDAVIPLHGSYRPLWLGLGALAFDMLVAVAVTSLLKKRIGHRNWRAVHWLSYAAWPVAVLHGLGTGSDVRHGWLLAIDAACVAAVWIAIFIRVTAAPARPRLAGLGALAALPLAALLWLPHGPLAKGWAKRAGTPTRLLLANDLTRTSGGRGPAARPTLAVPFSGYLGGTMTQTTLANGLARIDLAMHFSGGASGDADVRLDGAPLPGGGVSVQSSRVTLGPAAEPALYSGRVILLQGTRVVAELSDGTGHPLRADFRIALEQSRVAGTVSAVRH
jgi:methionine sulfoxide reductase heme-binding subunit